MSLDDRAYIELRPGQALENMPDPHWRHPAEEMEPAPDDDGEHDRMADAVLVISRLLETLWASGEPGGAARGKRPRQPLGANRLHEAVQRMAMRVAALSWMVCPNAVCRDPITLSDLAACLGVSRAMMSKLHVDFSAFLGGLKGPGGRSDHSRAQSRASRYAAIRRGTGVDLRHRGGGASGDSFELRDTLDHEAAERGLRKLARGHLSDSDRRGLRIETGHAVRDELRQAERHALVRRGWLGSDDVLTPAGVEALHELEVEQ